MVPCITICSFGTKGASPAARFLRSSTWAPSWRTRHARLRSPIHMGIRAYAPTLWTAVLLLFWGEPALACPVCHGETGRLVRAGIFDGDFFVNVALTLLPFPFLAGIVAIVHRDPSGSNEDRQR